MAGSEPVAVADGIVLRPVGEDDVPVMAQLAGELGYPSTAAEVAARLERLRHRHDHAVFLAEVDGAVAGMISVSVSPVLYRDDPTGAIVVLVVFPAYRSRGVAARLVAHGEAWLRENGAVRATVHPSTHRDGAHRFYARLGYAQTGLRFTKALGEGSAGRCWDDFFSDAPLMSADYLADREQGSAEEREAF